MDAPENVLERHRWTVAEYHRMAETGMLAPDARVELIDGEIIAPSVGDAIGPHGTGPIAPRAGDRTLSSLVNASVATQNGACPPNEPG